MTPQTPPARSALRLLVAEDEADLRESLADALRAAGHNVELATDGAEAIALAAANSYDALLSDINMPKMDGLQVLERMKATAPNTPIILMTAYAEVADAVAALKEGAYDYLTKPFEIDELLLQLAPDRPAPQPAPRAGPGARAELADRTTRDHPDRALAHHAPGDGADPGGLAERRPRAGHRRERHRQGAGRPHAARAQRARATAPSWWSTAGRCPRR